MKILENFLLKTVITLDYFNVYQINSKNVSKLIIRHFKLTHKATWFKKILFAVASCHNLIVNQEQSFKFILSNEITIHESSKKVIKYFTQLINTNSNLWIEQEFTDFSMKHWITIFLKSN